MSKPTPHYAIEPWTLSQEQEVAAARLIRDAVELLTIAAEPRNIVRHRK
jgi:hypothetical protein